MIYKRFVDLSGIRVPNYLYPRDLRACINVRCWPKSLQLLYFSCGGKILIVTTIVLLEQCKVIYYCNTIQIKKQNKYYCLTSVKGTLATNYKTIQSICQQLCSRYTVNTVEVRSMNAPGCYTDRVPIFCSNFCWIH